jgi:putative endonuclease
VGGFVYILASKSGVLYTGVTSQIASRLVQHNLGKFSGFTENYNVNRLVYFEHFGGIQRAIAREKQIKGWRRSKKVALIESRNPAWQDLTNAFVEIPQRTVAHPSRKSKPTSS